MRRSLCRGWYAVFFMLAALLLPQLSLAEEGRALRGYSPDGGYVYLNLGETEQTLEGDVLPIVWRVLSVEEDRAYIVSEYVLGNHRIHPDDNEWIAFGADFAKTEMCEFLNGTFAPKVFTEEELSYIVETEKYGRMFLLSSDDPKNKAYGFGTDKSRKAWGTEYAVANGLFKYGVGNGSHSPYWTLTQSSTAPYAARCTKAKGNLGWIRVVVENEGYRPACYLDLNACAVVGGKGTLDDPYLLGSRAE